MENLSVPSVEMIDIDNIISANTSSQTSRPVSLDVFQCKDLPDAIRHILSHNTAEGNNPTITDEQEQIFEIIEQLRDNPRKMFMYLQKHFAQHFDIDLYIVAFTDEKFSLIKKDNHDKNYMAFLSFNEDNTIRGPLYITSVNGTVETVFTVDQVGVIFDVYMYVTWLNDIKLSTGAPQIQEQQAVHFEQELREGHSTNEIQTSTVDPTQIDSKSQSRMMLDQMLRQIFQITDGLPIDPCVLCQVFQTFISRSTALNLSFDENAIVALEYVIDCFSNLTFLAELSVPNHRSEQVHTTQLQLFPTENNQNIEMQDEGNQSSPNTEILPSTSLPDNVSTTAFNTQSEEAVDIVNTYESPTLEKLLESEMHPRALKEFSGTRSNPVQCVDSKQRDSISVTVPSVDERTLYLDVVAVDITHRTHLSKIIVLEGTKVKNESLMNNNDLRCLNFNACDKTSKFDPSTKHWYLEISSTERQAEKKDIRIHMINLYQTGGITRKLIREYDLKKWQLALRFCVHENEQHKGVSPIWYSNIIKDGIRRSNKKTKVKRNGKRTSQKRRDVH